MEKKKGTSLHYKKKAFLIAFSENCIVGEAAKKVGIGRRTVYHWLEVCPEFAAEFESAKQSIVDKLEKEAIRRAYEGVEEPVFQGKELVGHVRKYSDVLLIFLLKGAAPGKYRERVEHTGAEGGAIKQEIVITDIVGKLEKLAGG